MRAIRVHTPGGPEVMKLEDVADPQPNAGEAVVQLEAIGVNFIDIYLRSGQYPLARGGTPGQEGAGKVIAVGAGVTDVKVGDRVAYTGVTGSYAERALVPARRLVQIPPNVSSVQAAAVMLQGMTAHYLAYATYPLATGHVCLIHAAAGGVGLLLVQLAKRRGARVLGTVSTEAKARLAREAGADEVILYSERDFVAEVRRLTAGRGVDVVYDSVGQTTFLRSLDALRPRGMMVLFGQSSGPVAPFDPQLLNHKGALFLTRPSLGQYTATREELLERSGEILRRVADTSVHVRVFKELPLADAAEAHRLLESRKTTGKLVLIP